jgi:DNA-binding response OmpR family regulator
MVPDRSAREDKVLVVEDNPAICHELEQQFNCDCASDGWDAIEKLETQQYAAIIIDADVPHSSGYGVLTYLREEVGEDLPNVIFMTSDEPDTIRRRVGTTLTVISKSQAVGEVTRVLG